MIANNQHFGSHLQQVVCPLPTLVHISLSLMMWVNLRSFFDSAWNSTGSQQVLGKCQAEGHCSWVWHGGWAPRSGSHSSYLQAGVPTLEVFGNHRCQLSLTFPSPHPRAACRDTGFLQETRGEGMTTGLPDSGFLVSTPPSSQPSLPDLGEPPNNQLGLVSHRASCSHQQPVLWLREVLNDITGASDL